MMARTRSAKAWLGMAGLLAAAVAASQLTPPASGASSGLLGEFRAGEGEAFITECMEAALMWKDDTLGWRLAATPRERAALRGRCSAAYAKGVITPEMQDVRAGIRIVRDSEEGVRTTSVF
jgi:hypothetical protein